MHMITVLDNTIKSGASVRSLLYTDDAELDGDTLLTENAGTVICEKGSIAMKPGFADMKQLGPDGWVEC